MPRSALCRTVGCCCSVVEGSFMLEQSSTNDVLTTLPIRELRSPLPAGERCKAKGRPCGRPLNLVNPQALLAHDADTAAAGAPDVDADEQEQPDHVDEVPVPGGEFEAEVLGRGVVAAIGADQADNKEDGADQHVEAVETGRHEEGRAIDVAREAER